MERHDSNHAKGSAMVKIMHKLHESSEDYLNFTYGYPEGANPSWVRKLQTHVPEAVFDDERSAQVFTLKIEDYFLNLFQADHISLTPSAGYAFCFLCDALIQESGDEIVFQDVSFEPYPKIVTVYKGKPVIAARRSDLSLSIDNIIKACTSRTKAIVLVMPDNPLGMTYNERDLRQLMTFCVDKAITLVVDYTFFQISPSAVPLITTYKEIDGLSYTLIGDTGKILGLKGSKFGALVYSDHWVAVFPGVISNYQFQHNQYDLYLISTILTDKRFDFYLRSLNALVVDNYNHIKAQLHPMLHLQPMEAAVFCVIDIADTGYADISLAQKLLAQYVGVIPLSYFYHDSLTAPTTSIRVSLARPPEEIKEFVRIINDIIDGEFKTL
ncbi:MAG TPA: pyridoxal phosphate-dependent aminotransferase [Candidatus Chromulinivoraceae bacterium]|nr:pyridoxal phosphate-dependent aminotransferase [Candidatus Chromulinivoraceae bacterium]